FSDLHLPDELEDRILWNYCQEHGWVLFTDNRNKDGPNSLEATLAESWQSGNLPVLTLSNKKTFEYSDEYQDRVGKDIAELLFGLYDGEFRDLRRIFVPTG
ncbi:MAG TPA: hypothetical protein VGZ26_04050, partial [Pirellulales bacterium]|nr:hypothetical protein [Pirellulales bacterium]